MKAKCGHDVEDGVKFCPDCGTEVNVEHNCPNCKTPYLEILFGALWQN